MSARDAAGGADLDRVVFFSDGVFAIAITLLVINLHVLNVAGHRLSDALLHLWPRVLSYGLSFAVIGLYWMGHHRMFRHIRAVDRLLIVLNLILLGLVAFLSHSASAVVGRSIRTAFASPRAGEYGRGLVFVARSALRVRYADEGVFD